MPIKKQKTTEQLIWERDARIKKLSWVATQYKTQIPAPIRAAIARAAGVENWSLDRLSHADRRLLRKAAKEYNKQMLDALLLLMQADLTTQLE